MVFCINNAVYHSCWCYYEAYFDTYATQANEIRPPDADLINCDLVEVLEPVGIL